MAQKKGLTPSTQRQLIDALSELVTQAEADTLVSAKSPIRAASLAKAQAVLKLAKSEGY